MFVERHGIPEKNRGRSGGREPGSMHRPKALQSLNRPHLCAISGEIISYDSRFNRCGRASLLSVEAASAFPQHASPLLNLAELPCSDSCAVTFPAIWRSTSVPPIR
ncbi:Uncharacterised protein [Bordetella pertussis]|nr:Uncharacterised protein [Bordetella pertussis]